MIYFILTLSNIIKNSDYYNMKYEFIIVFNNIQFCPFDMSELYTNKTMC